jgi:beta-lactam-binding protein with PASTA domain
MRGRGPIRWRRQVPPGLRYTGSGYGAAQAARRARFRRGLWWATAAVVAIVLLCCAGIVVSQVGFGGRPGPAPGRSAAPPVVPDVVGKRLPDALKALSTAGYRNTKRNDATGQGRVVFTSSSWIVQTQQPAGGSRAGHDTQIVLGVKRPSDGQGTVRAVVGEVPRVVCKDLQDAEQVMAAAGFVNVDVRDGSGRNRLRLLDRDWIVIAQSVPGGTRPDRGTLIVLTAVKFGEPTGDSGCVD